MERGGAGGGWGIGSMRQAFPVLGCKMHVSRSPYYLCTKCVLLLEHLVARALAALFPFGLPLLLFLALLIGLVDESEEIETLIAGIAFFHASSQDHASATRTNQQLP